MIKQFMATDLERDNVFVEFYTDDVQWAEMWINEETGEGKVSFFPDEKITVPYDELINALQRGFAGLQIRPPEE
jgi:hypothetical protein